MVFDLLTLLLVIALGLATFLWCAIHVDDALYFMVERFGY